MTESPAQPAAPDAAAVKQLTQQPPVAPAASAVDVFIEGAIDLFAADGVAVMRCYRHGFAEVDGKTEVVRAPDVILRMPVTLMEPLGLTLLRTGAAARADLAKDLTAAPAAEADPIDPTHADELDQ